MLLTFISDLLLLVPEMSCFIHSWSQVEDYFSSSFSLYIYNTLKIFLVIHTNVKLVYYNDLFFFFIRPKKESIRWDLSLWEWASRSQSSAYSKLHVSDENGFFFFCQETVLYSTSYLLFNVLKHNMDIIDMIKMYTNKNNHIPFLWNWIHSCCLYLSFCYVQVQIPTHLQ